MRPIFLSAEWHDSQNENSLWKWLYELFKVFKDIDLEKTEG